MPRFTRFNLRGSQRRYGTRTNSTRPTRRPALRGTAARNRALLRAPAMRRGVKLAKPRRLASLNGNVTNSICKYVTRPSPQVRTMERVGAPNQWTNQYSFRVDNAYGFQDVCSFNFADPLRLSTLPSAIGIPGTTGIAAVPYRYILESVIGNVTMANASTAPVELEIYDLVLKRDLPNNLNVYQNGSNWTAGSAPYPDVIWKYWIAQNNGQPATTLIADSVAKNIGASPFDCTMWKTYFKVKKRTHVLLTQGGVHRHAVLMKPNKLLDSTLFNQANYLTPDASFKSIGGIQGLTTYVMVIQKGLPVSDASSAPVVTTSANSVCYVQDYRYKYTWVADNQYNVVNGDSLTSPEGGQIINIGTGLAETVTFTV